MNMKKQYEYFAYLGKPLAGTYCSDNGFHNQMYDRGLKGFMINYLNPLSTFRSICINEVVTEHGPLDKVLAKYSAAELRNSGLVLPINFDTIHVNELNASYILNSSLCFVSVETKKGTKAFFATKNPHILSALSQHFAATELKKKLDSFQPQFTTNYSELSTGTFEVVTLTNDTSGLKLGKAKVNCTAKNTIITTMYALGNFIDSVWNYLYKNKVLIVYDENGEEKNLITTLIPEVLGKWIGTKNKNEVSGIIENSQNPFVYGELILPNLYTRKEFVNLHVLSIKSIRNFK